jgi:hypothetical protein
MHLKNFKSQAAGLLFGIVAMTMAAPVAQATTYGNTNDSGYAFSFGYPNTTVYGEEFTAPGGVLQSWTFTTDGTHFLGNAGNLDFVIASWNGTEAVGPALYIGATQYDAGTPDEALTWSGINLSLIPGSDYIAYLSVAGVTDPTTGLNVFLSQESGGLGGGFYYLNNDGVDPLTSPTAWTSYDTDTPDYMYYSATFAAVPEPITISLFGAGLAGVAAVRRRKKSKQV